MHPTFNNRHNPKIISTTGQEYWYSRSCAVVAEILIYHQLQQQWYVLLGKRGRAALDFQGYWGLPCGYLDWDETLCQAVIREVWEECGLYLPSLSQHPYFVATNSNLVYPVNTLTPPTDIPWHISDLPSSNRQNISFHYAIFAVLSAGELPTLSTEHGDVDEVEALDWIPIADAVGMELAFNHTQRIVECLDKHGQVMHTLVKHKTNNQSQ